MLRAAYPAETVREILLPGNEFRPYPRASAREAWEAVDPEARRSLVSAAEELLGHQWPALPATLQMRYARDGDRVHFERSHFARRCALNGLVLGECAEAGGRFMDDIVNGIWAICEESSWCIPAHELWRRGGGLPDTTDPVVDLFAAETAGQLAWISYLLDEKLDEVSVLIRPRIAREIRSRVLTPCLERDDFFFMMESRDGGRRPNNWNPWICSNWLAAALLIEEDEAKRFAHVTKIMRVLDRFLDPYPRDGGCDEGPGYWSRAAGSLFDCLDLFAMATEGRLDFFGNDLVKEMGRFIQRIHIAESYFVNFADGGALARPDASLVRAYGRRIGDAGLEAFGAWLGESRACISRDRTNCASGGLRALRAIFSNEAKGGLEPSPGFIRDVWLKDIQVMAARDRADSCAGFFIAAKGGHNNESHNHNDVGSFIVYVDGRPVIVDAGVELYSRKTFSDRRYDIWTMQSAFHTLLPVIDGVQQASGIRHAARDASWRADDASAELKLDIAATYPAEAGLRSWVRQIVLERGRGVSVSDAYDFERAPARLELGLLTPCEVEIREGAVSLVQSRLDGERVSGSARLEYDARVFGAACEAIDIQDPQLRRVWGDRLNRVALAADRPPASGGWRFTVSPV